MSGTLAKKLEEALLHRMVPMYVIEEETRAVVFANALLIDRLGSDPTGHPCHEALAGLPAPCAFCPACHEPGQQYAWEYFEPRSRRFYKVRNLFFSVDGRAYRAGIVDDMNEIMELNRSVVDYLALMKCLAEMQTEIIGNQDQTLQIIMDFLCREFSASEVIVTRKGPEGERRFSIKAGEFQREMPLAEQRSAPDTDAEIMVLDDRYAFSIQGAKDLSAWEEDKSAILHIVQLYLENAAFREKMEWENSHDRATKLYNRAKFMQMSHTRYEHLNQAGIIFLDIDNLKQINDTCGHDVGDLLIRKAADVLLACTDAQTHAYRMGGDEFVVVCCDAAPAAVERLLHRLEREMDTSNEAIPMPQLTISAGWAHGVRPLRIEALVTQADARMYEMKRLHKRGPVG